MRISAHKRCGWLDQQKSEVGLMKYHACRRHARYRHPCGNLGILPASESARKRLHSSAAKASGPVCTKNLDSDVAVMETPQNRMWDDVPSLLNRACRRSIDG